MTANSHRPLSLHPRTYHDVGASSGTFMRSETGANLEGSSPAPLGRLGSAPASIRARAMSQRVKMQARCSGRFPCLSAWLGSACQGTMGGGGLNFMSALSPYRTHRLQVTVGIWPPRSAAQRIDTLRCAEEYAKRSATCDTSRWPCALKGGEH